MEIIKIKHPYNKNVIADGDIVLILGYFDGVHLAHQRVIKEGVKIARENNMKAALMTFNRHPSVVYRKLKNNFYSNLTQPSQKAKIIESLGVDLLYEVFFNSEFGNLPPADFVDQYIVNLNAKIIVAGYDYTYGKPDIATMEKLPEYANNRFKIIEVGEEKEKQSGETISSTMIRSYIEQGEVEKANEMLGYNYETLGFVIHGDARGRELGYPTANIYAHPYTQIPGIGIYAVWFSVKGQRYMGMASVGRNVTFKDNADVSVEVNILDFNEEIYGDDVKIEWVARLRGEVKFNGADGLIKQLQEDEINTRNVLRNKRR